MNPTRATIIRQVMKQQSVSYATAKKFVDGALKEIEARLLNEAAENAINGR